ncbi:prepilin peptidase [bacterium]|nr:prepilin peptidase [bacterium]
MNALTHLCGTTGLPAGTTLAGIVMFGLCLGSFLNVVIWRLPRGESLLGPGSHCPACGTPVRWQDNVPLLGWLRLRGHCRDCAAPISPRYPLVEMLGGAALAGAALLAPTPGAAAATAAVLLALCAVFFIDLDHRLILDAITLPGTALGLLLCPLLGTSRLDAVAGAVAGFVSLWLAREGYRRLRGVEGLGLGDVKLAAMLGAWLGWQGVFMTLLIGSGLGTVVGVALILRRRAHARTALPYGVFLAPSAMAVTLWGHTAWRWYLSL